MIAYYHTLWHIVNHSHARSPLPIRTHLMPDAPLRQLENLAVKTTHPKAKDFRVSSSIMTDAEFDAARATIPEADTRAQLAAHDQAIARLYVESGWTALRIAEKVESSESCVYSWIVFWRWLILSSPEERIFVGVVFSDFYSCLKASAPGSYNARTPRIANMLASPSYKPSGKDQFLGKTIVRLFGDGDWHQVKDIAARIEEPEKKVAAVLEKMFYSESHGMKAEQRGSCLSRHYRLFPQGARPSPLSSSSSSTSIDGNEQSITISKLELIKKLGPIINSLKAEGRKPHVLACPTRIADLALSLEQQMNDWTK
jgi:hypothetical protein